MKRTLALVLTALLVFSSCAMAETYHVSANGFGGSIEMDVTITDTDIESVVVTSNSETDGVGSRAIESMPAAFADADSADIDGVAGATITSTALKEGVASALAQASGVEIAQAELAMADGVYTGIGKGYKGDIKLNVTVEANAITGIEIAESAETLSIGDDALPMLADRVIEAQSLAVDSISGATVTSAGFKAAMEDAIAQTGEGNVDALMAVAVEKRAAETAEYDCDIVVIGAGMAGLCAAIEAADNGANVILLEKLEVMGGSTSRSEGYVMGSGTDFQKENGVEDDPSKFFEDIYSVYQIEPMLNVDLLKKVCYDSQDLIPFLQENGVQFAKLTANTKMEPRATRRNHCTDGKGGALTGFLMNSVEGKGITVMMGTAATEIIKEDGTVIGVKATNKYGDDITIKANSTILCAGSYGGNLDMVKELNGNILAEIIKGCGDGDAYNMAKQAGAQMLNLDYPQLQYYFFWQGVPSLPVYPASAIAPVSNILLTDGEGKRVANESDFNFEFIEKVYYSGQQQGYCVVGQKFYEQYPEVCEAGLGKTFPVRGDEIAFKADTVAELAEWAGLDPETLESTVARYNELCAIGEDQDFGKEAEFMEPIEAPYYILKLPAVITDGYSGIKINENAQVIDVDGNTIPGFYAAGCCAVPEMSCVNYYGCGTSIATCGVYGRAAANHAVEQLAK